MSARYEDILGTAILGIDTLWGGDVMCASGTGRFIADSWFSDEPLPRAYTDPSAARVRASGGVSAKQPYREDAAGCFAETPPDARTRIRRRLREAAGSRSHRR